MERKYIIEERLYRTEQTGRQVKIDCFEVLNSQAVGLPVQTQIFPNEEQAEQYFTLINDVLRYVAGGQEAATRPASSYPHELKPLL